jgi:hypothetical protein
MILTITGIAKVWSACGSAKILVVPDPLLNIQFGHLMLAVGILELLIVLFCVCGRSKLLKIIVLTWLSSLFLVYRLGLWWIQWHRPCKCLGNLSDALPISPDIIDVIMKIAMLYLLIGSYTTLFLILKRRADMEEDRLFVLK